MDGTERNSKDKRDEVGTRDFLKAVTGGLALSSFARESSPLFPIPYWLLHRDALRIGLPEMTMSLRTEGIKFQGFHALIDTLIVLSRKIENSGEVIVSAERESVQLLRGASF